jgi:hypothetical protein
VLFVTILPQNAGEIKEIREGNMKKIAIIFVSLSLALCLAVGAHAAVVTTTPQESTAATSSAAGTGGDGFVYEADTALPIALCIIAVGGFIVYGIVKIKSAGKSDE